MLNKRQKKQLKKAIEKIVANSIVLYILISVIMFSICLLQYTINTLTDFIIK